VVSQSRGGRTPLDKPVSTVLIKDHCEYKAVWQLVPVGIEEMHTIYDYDR